MGSTQPKPDLTVRLSPNDFDGEETRKLRSYSSLERPSFVTPRLCYPFLMVEAKTGEEGPRKAERQNTHSAGIAVHAIIKLQRAASEATVPEHLTALFRKPLVFSISHNGRPADVYAHFAVPVQRDKIGRISFLSRNTFDRYKPYNPTLNLHQTTGQEHGERIKDALAALSIPSPPFSTSLNSTLDPQITGHFYPTAGGPRGSKDIEAAGTSLRATDKTIGRADEATNIEHKKLRELRRDWMSGPSASLVSWEDEASLLACGGRWLNTGWEGGDEGRCIGEKMSARGRGRMESCGSYGY
ncbi:MAG: hypothetical protein LQ349_002729 [Xanthoria aureola]|nr:MAG: hypothetical protein LQ349_002729 [Xanthoria aureola]